MVCSSRIISKMLPEIHTMEKSEFLKSIIHSQKKKLKKNNSNNTNNTSLVIQHYCIYVKLTSI